MRDPAQRIRDHELFRVSKVPNPILSESAFTREELRRGFRELVKKLYSDEFTKFRRDGFKNLLQKKRRKQKQLING